jgi:hypothetical protein
MNNSLAGHPTLLVSDTGNHSQTLDMESEKLKHEQKHSHCSPQNGGDGEFDRLLPIPFSKQKFPSIKQTLTGSSKMRGESHSTKSYCSIQ